MVDPDSGSHSHSLRLMCHVTVEKSLHFLIWASLFRKCLMNQTRYRNGRSRFWIPQSQSTFDVSCDRGKYLHFLIWASLFRKYFMNQTIYRNARPRFWIPQSQSTFDVSCDREKYLLYIENLILETSHKMWQVTLVTCDKWGNKTTWLWECISLFGIPDQLKTTTKTFKNVTCHKCDTWHADSL